MKLLFNYIATELQYFKIIFNLIADLELQYFKVIFNLIVNFEVKLSKG